MSDRSDPIHSEAAVAPGHLASHAARMFNRRVDAALRPHGLSLALIGPVMLLSWKGPMLQRDLMRASAVKQPAMVGLLEKLDAMNLVERAPTPEDRRSALVSLTARGRTIAEIGGRVLRGANTQGVEGFSGEEEQPLVGLLQRLIANLEREPGT